MKKRFTNLRGPTGTAVEILVHDGVITAIEDHLTARHPDVEVIDGQGALALPGLIDGHTHLDKTLAGLPWTPHPAGPARSSRIETEKALRAGWSLSVAERASHLLRQCIALGTTALRTHVDIDPDIGLENLHEILTVNWLRVFKRREAPHSLGCEQGQDKFIEPGFWMLDGSQCHYRLFGQCRQNSMALFEAF